MAPAAVHGRTSEVRLLAELCAGAAPGALVVEGDPGIGKTALLQAGVAAATSCRVISVRPTEAERSLPFGALMDVCSGADDEVLRALPAPQRQALDVALLREAMTSPLEQLAVSLALGGVLRHWAGIGPVLLVIDDAHWVDASSAQVLGFALRRLEAVRVRVVLARRTGHAGAGLDLPEARRLQLTGLARPALRELLAQRCGVEVAGPGLARLDELTGGNPLHALELVRALPDGARITSAPVAVQPSLAGLLGERLAELSDAAGELLLAAAATTRPTVALLTAWGPGLDEAVAAAVLVRQPDGVRVAFSHPLLAAAAYSRGTVDRRRAVHRRLAGLVTDPDERVLHRALGAVPPDAALADDLDAAAAGLRARGAPAAAAELLEHAARLTPAGDRERHGQRQVAAAADHDEGGDPRRAEELLRTLTTGLPAGPTRAAALTILAGLVPSLDTAQALLAQALDEVGDDEEQEARTVQLIHMYTGNQRATHAGDLAPLLRILRRAHEREDGAGWAEIAANVAFQRVTMGQGLDRALLERIEQVYDPASTPRFLAAADEPTGSVVAATLLYTEAPLEADRWLVREQEAYERTHRPTALSCVLYRRAQVAVATGRYEAAAAHLARSRELTRPVPYLLAYQDALDALVDAHLGRVEPARSAALRARAAAVAGSDRACWCWSELALAFLDLSLEDYPAASARYVALLPVVDEQFIEPSITDAWSDAAETLVALGRCDEADALLQRLEDRAGCLRRVGSLARAQRGRGLIEAARGDLTSAECLLRSALEMHEGLEDPLARGRTLLALGTVLRRARRKAAAKDTLEQALGVFTTVRAELWRVRAARELSGIGLRAPAATGPSGLTAVEQRVADLVATGLTNREVAAQLFMSHKTVETHLTHIFAKRQVRTRTELAHGLP